MPSQSQSWLIALLLGVVGCVGSQEDWESEELGMVAQAATESRTRTPSNDRNWQAWVDCTEECRYESDKCTVADPANQNCLWDKLDCEATCDAKYPPDWKARTAVEGVPGDLGMDRVDDPKQRLDAVDLDEPRLDRFELALDDGFDSEPAFTRSKLGEDLGAATYDGADLGSVATDFKCYERGCVCSDTSTIEGMGCEGMAAECARRGLPVRCTTRNLVCGCFPMAPH